MRVFASILAVLALGTPGFAFAQSAVPIVTNSCGSQSLTASRNASPYENTVGNLCTAASVSASITGFAPATTGTPISVTSSAGGVTGTLPAGTVVIAYNTGSTNDAFCKLGASSTTSDVDIPPKSWFAYTVGAATQLTCITSTSTTTVNMVGGSGLPTGAGGGGGSGGGGGNVTVVAPLGSALSAASVSVVVASDQAAVAVKQATAANLNATVVGTGTFATQSAITAASGALASGSVASGAIASGAVASGAIASGALASGAISNGADVVEGNNTDAASCSSATSLIACTRQLHTDATAAIPAGTNLIGKVGIDQTTPGTTNGAAIVGVNGATALAGNGTTGTGSLRVTVASDNTAFAVNDQPTPVTSGGLTTFFLQPAASDNHTNVKNGAGQVYHVAVTNNSATVNYLRFYNAATGFNGCNSATNLVYQLAIPANTSGAGLVQDIAMGLAFSTGISICVSSGYATTDTTNATASAMSLLIGYK